MHRVKHLLRGDGGSGDAEFETATQRAAFAPKRRPRKPQVLSNKAATTRVDELSIRLALNTDVDRRVAVLEGASLDQPSSR